MEPSLFAIESGRITVFGMAFTYMQILGILAFDVLIGVLGEEVARFKGHPKVLWLLLCAIFPPFLFLLMSLESRPRPAARAASVSTKPRPKVRKRAEG